jgi:hypothetical protein
MCERVGSAKAEPVAKRNPRSPRAKRLSRTVGYVTDRGPYWNSFYSWRQVILILSTSVAPFHDTHASIVEAALRRKGEPACVVYTDSFPQRLRLTLRPDADAGVLQHAGGQVRLDDVRAVWFRRQGLPVAPEGLSEAASTFAHGESRTVLRGLQLRLKDCFWVNPPWKETSLANDRLLQLRVAKDAGFRTPRSMLTNDEQDALAFLEASVGDVVQRHYAPALDATYPGALWNSVARREHFHDPAHFAAGPLLLQERVATERELRVVVIGDKVFAAEGRPYRASSLPETVESRCRVVVGQLGLAFAMIDLAVMPSQEYLFLDLHPSPQWLWLERATAQPLLDSLCEMLIQGRLDYQNRADRSSVAAADFPSRPADSVHSTPPAEIVALWKRLKGRHASFSSEQLTSLVERFPPDGPPPSQAELLLFLTSLAQAPEVEG